MSRRRPASDDLDFHPAAVELRERSPALTGRLTAAAVAAVVLAALGWAVASHVDVVAVARGRLVPAGQVKRVQALEGGRVRAIRVGDGTEVRAGQVLVEIDPTAPVADQTRLEGDHRVALAHVARLRALLAGVDALSSPPGADFALVRLQHELLHEQRREHAQRLRAADLAVAQRRAAVEASRASVERLQSALEVQTERARAFRLLLDRELVARLQYLEVEERRLDRAQELAIERQRLIRDEAAVAEALEQRALVEAEFRRARHAELADWEARAAALAQDLVKARQRREATRVAAPAAGRVHRLTVHTTGAVVVPGQELMVIVPQDATLEVEAWAENKDIGFLAAGQPAEVKLDTFSFTRYGSVPGRVAEVAPDAVRQEGAGLAYLLRVSLDHAWIVAEGEPVPLAAGMAATVEVKIGRRRLIDFVLSPLLRAGYESLRER